MQLRKFEERDRLRLQALYLAARTAAFPWQDASGYQLTDFDRAVLGEAIWVAESDNELLGFVAIYQAENFIHHLYVDPHLPPQGVGSALLHAAQATFSTPGSLKCLTKNEKALNFYRKYGWQIVETGNDGSEDYYLMCSAKE
jgi:ribosomal protein S18 acetylase RimI-like enzyme